ncbi:MAG TPA: lipocalin-like domain-containing protein [Xanthobacteraceae bacterium]|nr:lipocalin-like domain-containing protein [Xanthobacteraceae bacterium]
MATLEALLGTWKMLSWRREIAATGQQVDALGPDPVGFINYGADGRFYAIVTSKDRTPPVRFPPTDDEKLNLFNTMLAYTGTYTLDDEEVVHHVDASWNQAGTGTDQVRFYKLNGDKLSITSARAPDPFTGEEVVHRVEFQKLPRTN